MFASLWEMITDYATPERLRLAARASAFIVFGFLGVRLLAGIVRRLIRKRVSPQTAMIVRKAIFYTGATLIVINVLQQFGLQLTALLGAAGIAGIAVGFAAQTSMSNLISGLFLISEKPFAVGDVIKVGGTTGLILSIDLLSVKVRTFDNRFVRIPNSTLINSETTNITYFPIRRMDIKIGVAYKEDVRRVREVLLDIAHRNPFCLEEPEPLIVFSDFGDSALELLYAVWFQKTDYLALKNSIMQEIKERFDAEGIEIPFPHRTLYVGSRTDPFPVRLAAGPADEPDSESGR